MVTTPTLWGEEVTLSTSANAFSFQAEGLADNTVTVVWSDTLGDIHGRLLDPLGNFASTDFLFNLSQSTSQSLRQPEVIQQEDGSIRVLYSYLARSSDEDIYANFPDFDATGGSNRGLFVINTAKDEFKLGSAASTINNAPDTVVVYTQLRGTTQIRDLYFSHLGTGAVPIGSPQLVPINAGESVSDAKVVGLPNGNTLITYTAQKFDSATGTTESFVRYRIYDDYTDISGAREASTTPGNDSFPAVAALPRSSDGFVIATQDALGIRILYHAFGREFTKSVPGTLSSGGGAFPKAITPKITALNDQGFIVAWTDTSETEGDGSPALKIGMQRFDKNANAVGTTLYINAPGDQSLSSITTLADGRVLLTYDNETGDSTNTFTHDYRIVDPREPTILGTAKADDIVGREDGSKIFGYEGADTLTGRAASDRLDGGSNADTMTGAGGDDSYYVDSAGDLVVEVAGGGTDTVLARANYTLGASAVVEVLRPDDLAGTAGLKLTGNGVAQKLYGNAGGNVLDGKGGGDTMMGLGGNDTYVVDVTGDKVIESANAGTDTVQSAVSFTLGANIEKLILTGTSNISGTGNGLANTITGNSGVNILAGGLGNDTLDGGSGRDFFLFNTKLGSGNVDRITAFSVADDTIRLENAIFKSLPTGTLASGAFKNLAGGAAVDADDRLLYDSASGKLYYDADGSGTTARVLFAILDNQPSNLSNADFLVV